MNTTTCRDCAKTVSLDAVSCPHCGAPRPAQVEWNGEGYEWKSAATLAGWPVVHIAFGIDRDRKMRTARGVIAIGQRAVGGFAFGILSAGIVSMGVVSGGVLSLGVVSLALLGAVGVNAVGPFAFGVSAVGGVVGGVHAVGWKTLIPAGLR